MNSPAAAARESLFGDALACEEMRAAAFLPGPVGDAMLRADAVRGEALLRSLAVIEDSSHRTDEPDQLADHVLLRMEAKIDLLTSLVAGLHAGSQSDPVRALEWSARGACLHGESAAPVGTIGRFRVLPADWLPSPLLLPATVLAADTDAVAGPRLWLRFGPLPPALQAALERHLFRIHRRLIAERRRRSE